MAELPLVPHFDLPFRFDGTQHVAVVDQDTLEDVGNCVQAIVRTAIGQRQEYPDFGITDITLQTQPINQAEILDQIIEFEPRASGAISQAPDNFDSLIANVLISVSTKGVT